MVAFHAESERIYDGTVELSLWLLLGGAMHQNVNARIGGL